MNEQLVIFRRNFFLIVIGIFISFNVIGQPVQSKIVTASLPPGTMSITKVAASKYLDANFKHHKIPVNTTHPDVKNYYLSDGLIIPFWDYEADPYFKKSLEDMALGMIGLLRRNNDTIIFHDIVTFNSVKFFEYEYQTEDEVFLLFQSDSNAKIKILAV